MAKLKLSINFLQLRSQVVDLLVRGCHIHNKLPALQFKWLRYAGKGDLNWRNGTKNCFLYRWILSCQFSQLSKVVAIFNQLFKLIRQLMLSKPNRLKTQVKD